MGVEISAGNTSTTSSCIIWSFNTALANSYLLLDPPDIPPQTLSNQKRSIELVDLLPGTFYKIYIFPFLGSDVWTSPKVGDPLSTTFETNLEDPTLNITDLGENGISGMFSIFGRFVHAKLFVLHQYENFAEFSYADNGSYVWRIEDLIPMQNYSLVLEVHSENEMKSISVLNLVTKPPLPYLRDQLVNEVDDSVVITIELPHSASIFEFEIICDTLSYPHGPMDAVLVHTFGTLPEQFGCKFKTRCSRYSSFSDWLEFVVGVAVLEDFRMKKTHFMEKDFTMSWKVRTGWYSHLSFSYQGDGTKEVQCAIGLAVSPGKKPHACNFPS